MYNFQGFPPNILSVKMGNKIMTIAEPIHCAAVVIGILFGWMISAI